MLSSLCRVATGTARSFLPSAVSLFRSISTDEANRVVKIPTTPPLGIYRPPGMAEADFAGPPLESSMTVEELRSVYQLMARIRRMEVASDQQYKRRAIRGFCHLYTGEEACCTGIEYGIRPSDAVITAYRDHGNHIARGGSVEEVLAEQFGRVAGCSKGKGGSMHMYRRQANFFGGNGIVGAQCPIGAGIAWAQKFAHTDNLTVCCFGDGAANQGQLAEAINMASMWTLPVLYVCENNLYAMGTSVRRGAAGENFYDRGVTIPGIKVEGMDVFAVREAVQYSADYIRRGNGPVYLELTTYRYAGHSMSDPGVTYRTRDEVTRVRNERDPISLFRETVLPLDLPGLREDDLKKIDKDARAEVAAALERALASPAPDPSALFEDVYAEKGMAIRDVEGRTHPSQ